MALLTWARRVKRHLLPPTPSGERVEPSDGEIFLRRATIVRFSGGLANQMLCYKLLRYLVELRGGTAIIDATSYGSSQNVTNRNFQLLNHPLRYDMLVFSRGTVARLVAANRPALFVGRDLLNGGEDGLEKQIIAEDVVVGDLWLSLRLRSSLDEAAARNGALDDLALDGASFLSEAGLKCLALIRDSGAPVAIHVRRGDFETHDNNLLVTIDYYNRAIRELEASIAHPDFFVFSDDIAWCRKNLQASRPLHFVSVNDERNAYKDMFLASQCRHFILSNESTFSHQIVQLCRHTGERIVIRSTQNDLERNQPEFDLSRT